MVELHKALLGTATVLASTVTQELIVNYNLV